MAKKNTGIVSGLIILSACFCFLTCVNPIMEKWWEEPVSEWRTSTPTVEFYTVTFNANGGTPIPGNQKIVRGEKVGKVAAMSRGTDGFGGWYTDDGRLWDFATDKVTHNMTLTAKWVPSASYTVTFELNDGNLGGVTMAPLLIAEGAKIPEPTAMRRPFIGSDNYYGFGGWFKDDGIFNEQWNFATDTVSSNITLYAKWDIPTCSVRFDADGGAPEPRYQDILIGAKVVEPYAMSKDGYAFGGWFTDPGLTRRWDFNTDTTIGSSLTLYAKWVTNYYTVTFNANGGSPAPGNQSVAHGTKAAMPPPMRRPNYGFDGWYTDQGSEWNFDAPVTANITLNARWSDEYFTIIFDSAGGPSVSLPARQVVAARSKIIEPPDPSRTGYNPDSGYSFAGWVIGYDKSQILYPYDPSADAAGANAKWWDFDTPVTEDITEIDIPNKTLTLYAYWVPNHSDLAWVKRGSFMMGDDHVTGAKPAHKVILDGFYIGKYPVTQAQYNIIMSSGGTHANHFIAMGDSAPVDSITWDMANAYCVTMSSTGITYRLPTEAEWEYAARGGNGSPGNYIYAGSDDPDAVGWYNTNSGSMTRPVGTKQPNGLGIYDMSGNISEWCSDWYDANYYSTIKADSPDGVLNPKGPASGTERVRRGGSWNNAFGNIRTTIRNSFAPTGPTANYWTLGFRIVREADPAYYPDP